MQALRAVMRKELLHIRREPQLVGYVVALPVLVLLLFGYALRLKVDDLTIAVCDQDKSFFSFEVKNRLGADAGLHLEEVDSPEAVQTLLYRGTAHLGLVIPAGFARHVVDGEQTTFRLLVDGTMPSLAQAGLYGSRVLTDDGTEEALNFTDADAPPSPLRKHPIKVEESVLFNPRLRDSDYFLPGTLGLVVMLVSLNLSTGIVREKEQQTIEQLWATPISRFALVAGKVLPYAILTAADFAVALWLSHVVFALPVQGSLLGVVVLAALFIVSLLALGTFLSVISDTQIQAHFGNVVVFTVSLMMSGFIFPVEAMPRWLQPVAAGLPMTYFLDGLRGLVLKGAGVRDVAGDLLALTAFTVGFGVLCTVSLKKQAT